MMAQPCEDLRSQFIISPTQKETLSNSKDNLDMFLNTYLQREQDIFTSPSKKIIWDFLGPGSSTCSQLVREKDPLGRRSLTKYALVLILPGSTFSLSSSLTSLPGADRLGQNDSVRQALEWLPQDNLNHAQPYWSSFLTVRLTSLNGFHLMYFLTPFKHLPNIFVTSINTPTPQTPCILVILLYRQFSHSQNRRVQTNAI